MSELLIDYNSEQGALVLRGNIQLIKQKRRLWIYLSDSGGDFSDSSYITIPANLKNLGPLVSEIEDAFIQHQISFEQSPALAEAIKEFSDEKDRFRLFSTKAENIWNREFPADELLKFSNAVSKKLTGRTLYPLQLLAAYHLAFSQNAANFSVPGAGKTSVVYGAFSYLNSLVPTDAKYVNKLVVIGPLSCFGPWEDEFKECFGREAKAKRVFGAVSKDERRNIFLSELPEYADVELILTTYQSVSSNLEYMKLFLQRQGIKAMVVLDEAHKIKNTSGGIWSESVLELASSAASRVVLTGTPAPNGYEDIYNLFKFIWPDQNVIGYGLNHLRDMSNARFDKRIEALVDNISPYFIRIRKSDLQLPAPIENAPIVVEMAPHQENIYRYIEKKYVNYFESQQSNSWLRDTLTKARLIRLMQAATNPGLLRAPLSLATDGVDDSAIYVDDTDIINEIMAYADHEIPAKFRATLNLVKRLLSESAGNKVVIWCVFIANLDAMQALLNLEGIESRILCGRTPSESDQQESDIETRESIIREFGDTKSRFKVILANPFAVGESISLHKACRSAIYLERNFNGAAFMQSKDRIHRYGLPKDAEVNYYYILSKDTVDDTIHQRLLQKEAAMARIIESRDIPLLNLNMDGENEESDDIAAVIRDYARRRDSI